MKQVHICSSILAIFTLFLAVPTIAATVNPSDATSEAAASPTTTPKAYSCPGTVASGTTVSAGYGPYSTGVSMIANQPTAPVADSNNGVVLSQSFNCEYNRSDQSTNNTQPSGYMTYWRACPDWTDPITGKTYPTVLQYIYVTSDIWYNQATCQAVCYATSPRCQWQ